MNKIEYGNLYKFFVSLGMIFFFFPVLGAFFLINLNPPLISQDQINSLSEYSSNFIERKKDIFNFCFAHFSVISTASICLGFFLTFFGIIKWWKNQSKEDAILAANQIKMQFEADRMTVSDIIKKAAEESEIESSSDESDLSKKKEQNSRNQKTERNTNEQKFSLQNELKFNQSLLFKYFEIEDRYFKHITTNFSSFCRRHSFYRNIRIGKYEYDAIAVSTETNTDLIYEIKYWRTVPLTLTVINVFEKLKALMNNYKQLQQRDCEIKLIIVSPDNKIDRVQHRIFDIAQIQKEKFPIAVEFIHEESLPQL